MDINKIPQELRDQIPPEFLDQLAQELNKPVFGEKTYEPHLPALSRQAAADGAVLLKNDNGILPLKSGETVAVFGRVQQDWFYVGYGSGGDVNPPYKVNLMEGLENAGVAVDQELARTYAQWCGENEPFMGFWGHWPRYFEEMPLTDDQVKAAASRCGTALVVIGRAAGEARENDLEPGSYYLTEDEKKLLSQVSSAFEKTAVIIDAGSILDLSWLNQYSIAGALFVWQGGMESGNAVAGLLTGKVTPSGKLSDTVALRYEDYPSQNFLGKEVNQYTEDIYVGYRYFETFAKDAVQFPFGFGLSYTTFALENVQVKALGDTIRVKVSVKNTGSCPGKEVVQVYASAPQGKLGKASRVLCAFQKTKLLQPGQSQALTITYPVTAMASFDDSGATGHKNAWVLEAGDYAIYVGTDVRSAQQAGTLFQDELRVLSQLQEVCAPVTQFDRLVNKDGQKAWEPVPQAERSLKERILDNLATEIPFTGDQGIKLKDVDAGLASMEDFVAQLTPEELEALTRGDYVMDSSQGTKGNAGVLGGILESLREKGVPPITTTDGPSGIRLQFYCSLLPCGTCLACTWDPALVESLYQSHGREMVLKGSDVLLGPGMNIHRNPLCGRNFEYFAEDPLLSGKTAAAVVRGIQKNGVSACPKHFACNNQETNREYNDSQVSQRALREIYLKGFEICIQEAAPHHIMTSYNKINGVWNHYNYDLCTTVLRGEWNYGGSVMTDWWERPSEDPDFPDLWNSAYRVRSQVDVLMPGAVDHAGSPDTAVLESYQKGGLTLAELQRGAKNVLGAILGSVALSKQN